MSKVSVSLIVTISDVQRVFFIQFWQVVSLCGVGTMHYCLLDVLSGMHKATAV